MYFKNNKEINYLNAFQAQISINLNECFWMNDQCFGTVYLLFNYGSMVECNVVLRL